jgi:hypothetical protein
MDGIQWSARSNKQTIKQANKQTKTKPTKQSKQTLTDGS